MNVVAYFLREKTSVDDVVIWLAYSEELCNQAANEFELAWGNFGQRPLTVFRHYGANRVPSLSDVKNGFFVSSLPLLYKHSLDYQSEFLKLAGRTVFIVFDEAHQLPAPTYQHLVDLLHISRSPSILGLSATPGRAVSQENSDALKKFFNGNRVALEVGGYSSPVEYLQKEGYLASPIFEDLNIPWGAKLRLTEDELVAIRSGFDLPDTVLLKLGASDYRNLAIIRRIETELHQFQAAGKTMKLILFACSVKQSKTLANILKKRGIAAYSVTGDTESTHRKVVLDEFRNSRDHMVLTNYGVLTTGFDAPKTNIAFIARPTSSVGLYSQMVGRALRGYKVGGNAVSKIISVQDNIPGFHTVGDLFNHWNNIWEEN
jgi:superfamily II DNA or RNA helicase